MSGRRLLPDVARTRLIRPEFFADERMAHLSVTTRLVYIGLWTLCDDAGYFELKPRQIAVELFPWDGPGKRSRAVDKALEELIEGERVKVLSCAEHGLIATVPEYRIQGGNHSFQFQKQHRSRCGPEPVRTGSTYQSRSESESESDSESVSLDARARGKTLDDVSLEAGGFAARQAERRLKAIPA